MPPVTQMAKDFDLQRSKLRWLMALVMLFSLVPSALLLTVGVLILVLGHATKDVVFGVLILGLASTLLGGVAATVLYVRRETTVARLQTEFVSKVSHDLRTPLTSIRLFAETLQGGRLRDPHKVRQALDMIVTETARLTAMINRLLGWARMEAGRRVYHMKREAPAHILDEALLAFEPLRLSGDVQLERQDEPDLPPVRADLPALSEAVLNLLQNAFHYTGPDKRIRVQLHRRADRVALSVTDNGPGIAKQEHGRIFEKFYRVARDDARVQGTGLGLAIVYHIVRAHGGTTQVESEPGKGATFTILLPPVPSETDSAR